MIVSSHPPANRLAWGFQVSDRITDCCPVTVFKHFPVWMSQSRNVLSWEPLAKSGWVGFHATNQTQFVCPLKIFRHSPVWASQSRTVASWELLTNLLPSTLHTTDQTELWCPRRVTSHVPVWTLKILMIPSSLQLASRGWFGCHATQRTGEVLPVRVYRQVPVSWFQILMQWSFPALASSVLSEFQLTVLIASWCPSSTWRHSPLWGCQSRTIKSLLPEARIPVWLQVMDWTAPFSGVMMLSKFPVANSQILIVWSSLLVAKYWRSGLSAIAQI